MDLDEPEVEEIVGGAKIPKVNSAEAQFELEDDVIAEADADAESIAPVSLRQTLRKSHGRKEVNPRERTPIGIL